MERRTIRRYVPRSKGISHQNLNTINGRIRLIYTIPSGQLRWVGQPLHDMPRNPSFRQNARDSRLQYTHKQAVEQ